MFYASVMLEKEDSFYNICAILLFSKQTPATYFLSFSHASSEENEVDARQATLGHFMIITPDSESVQGLRHPFRHIYINSETLILTNGFDRFKKIKSFLRVLRVWKLV